jgi:hypothetical protein
VVGFRANAADTLGYLGHILSQAALAKFLKSPEFRNLEIGIGYTAIPVEKYGNFAMTFKAGNGVYHYFFHFILALLSNEFGRL